MLSSEKTSGTTSTTTPIRVAKHDATGGGRRVTGRTE
jgi:hypothetical protein